MQISQASFLAAWKNKKLVVGALKAAHVRRDFVDYEDLLQDGLLLYAQMLDVHQDLEREQIDKLSFRRVLWHTIDELRKKRRVAEHAMVLQEATTIAQKIDWDNLCFLKNEVEKLTSLERCIFFEHLLADHTLTSLVGKCGVTRQTLQRAKRKLLLKLRQDFKA